MPRAVTVEPGSSSCTPGDGPAGLGLPPPPRTATGRVDLGAAEPVTLDGVRGGVGVPRDIPAATRGSLRGFGGGEVRKWSA